MDSVTKEGKDYQMIPIPKPDWQIEFEEQQRIKAAANNSNNSNNKKK